MARLDVEGLRLLPWCEGCGMGRAKQAAWLRARGECP